MSEEIIDQQIDAAVEKWHATKTNMSMALGSFATIGLATHSPGGVFLGGCVAYVAARHGDSIAHGVRNAIPQEVVDIVMKRFGHDKGAQPKEDDNVTRLLPGTLDNNLFDFDAEEDDVLPTQSRSQKKDGIFRFSELLATGFVPTINKIFVGRTMDGKDIFVPAKDLCHVALAGKTGGGKGSLERLIMVQLCYVGARVLLLNPHYMRWVVADNGPQFDEDWTPFEGVNPRKNDRPYLEASPLDCADFDPIGQYLAWAVETELQKRKREGREGGKKFKPFFIVIDEWPSIVAKIREAPGHLGELLREGRKFGIFVILTSQDFQVKTLGMEGGSIRNCFLTVFYTGGDKTTAKELLHYEKVGDIPENSLGKGIILIRCTGTNNEPVLVRVPFVDNEAVYKLLGPSTFKKVATVRESVVLPQQQQKQPVQNEALTLDEAIRLVHEHPEIDPMWFMSRIADYRETDDLPVAQQETRVMRSPYYPQSGPMREQVAQYPTYRKSTPTLPPDLQKALDAYESGMSYRELGAKLGIGKDAAGKRIEELKRRKLI